MNENITADLSQLAYLKNKQPKIYKGWTRDLGYSPANSTIWRQDNEIILAIRGTDIKNLTDLSLDALIIGNALQYSNRLKAIKKRFRDITKDNQDIITICGHSLAGSLCLEMIKDFKILDRIDKCIVYNPGTAHTKAIEHVFTTISCKLKKRARCKQLKQKLVIYHGFGDPLSFLSRLDRTGLHVNMGIGHSINNFTSNEPVITEIEPEIHGGNISVSDRENYYMQERQNAIHDFYREKQNVYEMFMKS